MGRCLPSALGMYTRLTGLAWYFPTSQRRSERSLRLLSTSILSVRLPRLPIDARYDVPLARQIRFTQAVNVVDVKGAQSRGEPHLLIPAGCLSYPIQRTVQVLVEGLALVYMRLCAVRSTRYFAGFGKGVDLILAEFSLAKPFPPPASKSFWQNSKSNSSPASRVLRACPTSRVRSSPSFPFRVHGADMSHRPCRTWDLPASVRRGLSLLVSASVHAHRVFDQARVANVPCIGGTFAVAFRVTSRRRHSEV